MARYIWCWVWWQAWSGTERTYVEWPVFRLCWWPIKGTIIIHDSFLICLMSCVLQNLQTLRWNKRTFKKNIILIILILFAGTCQPSSCEQVNNKPTYNFIRVYWHPLNTGKKHGYFTCTLILTIVPKLIINIGWKKYSFVYCRLQLSTYYRKLILLVVFGSSLMALMSKKGCNTLWKTNGMVMLTW